MEKHQKSVQKQFYLDLWQKLSEGVVKPTQPEVLVAVAGIALKNKYSADQTRAIVGQSPAIQKVLKERGRETAYEAARLVVREAELKRERERKEGR